MKHKECERTDTSKKLIEFFRGIAQRDIDQVVFQLATDCSVRVGTVNAWRLGHRNPSTSKERPINKFISNFQRNEHAQ